MPNYWMENAITPSKHVLVDCGSWPKTTTQRRFLALRKHLSLTNFQRVGNDRLVARIPPRKVDEVMVAMPRIKIGAAIYCWCTHGFTGMTP